MSSGTWPTKRVLTWASVVAIIALGAWLRLVDLAERPMHTDEAVHAVKLHELQSTGRYAYDPADFHGPTLYYATLPVLWLCGARDFADYSEAMLRCVPALFGIALILLPLLLIDGIGRVAALSAAALTAVSPVLVYYSRYYIQETLLAFFSLALIVAGWRYARSRRVGWAVVAGVAAGLMHATKETCVISWACMGAALLVVRGAYRASDGESATRFRLRANWVGISVAIVVALVVSAALMSNFGANPRGAVESYLTYASYAGRSGGGCAHAHPWGFYFKRLLGLGSTGPVVQEWPIVALAVLGAGLVSMDVVAARMGIVRPQTGGVPPRRGADSFTPLSPFLLTYAVLMAIVYSAIPYKTPWCAVQFWLPTILVAGVGATALVCSRATRFETAAGAVVLLCALLVQLMTTSLVTSRRFSADPRNPWVYAHTLRDARSACEWVEKLAGAHPDGRQMLVAVVADDPWPLPWYLRRLERVGYWTNLAGAPRDAPVIVADAALEDALAARLGERYEAHAYGLRPGARILVYSDAALRAELLRRAAERRP